MLTLVLSGSIRYSMVSRERVDGLQQVTLSASGQQKPKIQGSCEEHQLGKESGLELPIQLLSRSNPNPSLPCPHPSRAQPSTSCSEPPSCLTQGQKCPHAVQAAVACSSENQPPGTFSLQDPDPALGSVVLSVLVQPVGLIPSSRNTQSHVPASAC